MGHFGQFLDTLQPSQEPLGGRCHNPHFPDKEIKTLYDPQKLTQVENLMQCGNSQTLGARFKFCFFSCRGLSTEGTFQRGLVVKGGINSRESCDPAFGKHGI